MPQEPDGYVVDFPTLWVAADWIEHHCIVPDGFDAGHPFELADWQLWFVVNHYRVKPSATVGQLAPAFQFRRSQIVMPQKAGKAPLTAAQICLEGVGPALFDGWSAGSDAYVCAEHGCGCGWVYEYGPGEPMGREWPTPLIQITATSEEQTDNIYDSLRPMIDDGPLHELVPKTGEEFIRLPRKGRIDVVSSNARSRLGQRVTFVPQDETGIWTPRSGMVKVAETQRRGLAGMGGRSVETTNAWDPTEDSVAKRTAESKRDDIFRLHPLPPAKLDYAVKRDRIEVHRFVYRGSPWVDLDAIEAEAAELLERDPAQAERFFGNRAVAGSGTAFDADRWAELADATIIVPDGSLVVAGVDGARFHDSLAIVGTDVRSGHQWKIGIWEEPEVPVDGYEHDLEAADAEMLAFFDRFDPWRVYVDPQYIEVLFDRWQGRWGDKKILPWWTYRTRPMAFALRRYLDAQVAGDLTHDGDSVVAQHVANATRKPVEVRDDDGRRMWTIRKPEFRRKIDAAMAGTISWEARSDALAAGALEQRPRRRRAWTS